jgi:potassium-dependent mechanosensitive channel
MYKRFFACLLLALTICIPSNAVLKEKNLSSTLSILRNELTKYYNNLQQQAEMINDQQGLVRDNIINILSKSNQNALMLYSQKPEYIFNLTYACHEAIAQYANFKKSVLPFQQYINKNSYEVARYDSLITNLSEMPTTMMDAKAQIDRDVCLTFAISIRRMLKSNNDQQSEYIKFYNMAEQRLHTLNDYANKRYQDIQQNIFVNGGDDYFTIIRNIGSEFRQTKTAVMEKYRPLYKVSSQWDSRIIFFLFAMIIIYGFISLALNVVTLRYLLPKRFRTESFMAKRTCIMLATSTITFALIIGLVRIWNGNQNFIIMASGLLVEYAWLLGVILFSLLVRLDGDQMKDAFHIYSPLMLVGFIVIAFRIILIPNDLVNLVFPPFLLACMLWQLNVIKRYGKKMPRSDMSYNYLSLLVFIASTVCSWIGYTLLSVQLLIWWIMQLTCILTITCIKGWLDNYAIKKHMDEKPISSTWFFKFIMTVVLQVTGVLSVLLSIYWAASIFNLNAITWNIYTFRFLDSKNFTANIITIATVFVLYFFFKYINQMASDALRSHFSKSNKQSAESINLMGRHVIQVIIWGVWLIMVLNIFHVSNTWLVVITGGLSTGIGFASKDILENIYYGISLMTGRVKIGDWIDIDGTRGKVTSISYTSTTMETIDGSVVAFQNSQLFSKNYKNMTRNHGYELDILEVGVAYGTDIPKIKQILVDNLSKLPFIYKQKTPAVVMKSFADSSITLKILVWVPVLSQYYDDGIILECVYKTLNDNNITIPFPQREVRILHADSEGEAAAI